MIYQTSFGGIYQFYLCLGSGDGGGGGGAVITLESLGSFIYEIAFIIICEKGARVEYVHVIRPQFVHLIYTTINNEGLHILY